MKNNYLNELKELLDNYVMDESEKNEIIADYDDMYNGYFDKGITDDEIVKKLGSPRSIVRDLTEGYRKVEKPLPGGGKFIALTPFIALISYFILGLGYNLWHPGWVVFVIIPISAIIVEMGKTRDEQLTTALSPFFATLIYLYIGFYHDLWHPGWIIFIIIPILGVWNSRRTLTKLDLIVSLSPFLAGISYIFLGLQGYWTEGWVIFLIIPMLGILNEKKIIRLLIWELLIIIGVVGYLYVAINYPDLWAYGLLAFVPLIVAGIITGDITVIGMKDIAKEEQIIVGGSIVVFLLLGFIFDLWGVAWLIFLAFPVYEIHKYGPKKGRMVSTSPFVALVLFFTVGYFFDLWEYSWMAFLLIPIVAIVKNN